jgi:hypothetical protein
MLIEPFRNNCTFVLSTYVIFSGVTANTAHGQPLTAPFGNGAVEISLVKTSNGTPIASNSFPFAGNALAFHTLSGAKFKVTYTVSATARELSSSTQASSS